MNNENENSFRDKISTVSEEGNRLWVYPKKPKGRFHRARIVVAIILLAILFITPFIKVNGNSFFLFNFFERKFILFGLVFGPHDFFIFVLGFIALIVFVILFTAVYGRIFCGWICPQTIFMEMVFRKIEYWIEGDASKQRALDAQKMNGKKFVKKFSKHLIFLTLSFLIGNLLMAYLIGIDETLLVVTQSPNLNFSAFLGVVFFSLIFYAVFARFREQACTIVCPYGRLQGVLLDQNSIVVAYDYVRGEPRGKIKKDEIRTSGDCIECGLCYDVCPTGIDIKNGIQLECINCTACIDACDEVMDKVGFSRGLIRYASLKNIQDKIRFKFTTRIAIYTLILTLLLAIFGYLLTIRTDVDIKILRIPGMLYQDQPNDRISNLYNVNIVNNTFDSVQVKLTLKNIEGELNIIGDDLNLDEQEKFEGRFMIIFDKSQITKVNTPIEIGIIIGGKEVKTVKTAFLSKIGSGKNEK